MVCESSKDPMTELVRVQGPHLFTQTNHTSIWKVVCVKFLNLTSTFVWNFLDVFIMTISIALSTQFELFNRELIRTKNEVIYYKNNIQFLCANHFFWLQHIFESFWKYRRIQYRRLCDLVDTVDSQISHVILLSFFNNIFFTCKQLFQSLR